MYKGEGPLIADADVKPELPAAQDLASLPRLVRNQALLRALVAGRFDFLDFGTHRGAGLRRGASMGGTCGLGIDLDDNKATALLQEGYYVLSENIVALPEIKNKVNFAICSHILEHLSHEYDVGSILSRLAKITTQFIYIEQPNFSTEERLYRLGLTIAHSTLSYHPWHGTCRDMANIFWNLGLFNYVMGGKLPMVNSGNEWIHRADSAPNRSKWDEAKDKPKADVDFGDVLYRDMIAVVGIDATVDLENIARKQGMKKVFLRSYASPS